MNIPYLSILLIYLLSSSACSVYKPSIDSISQGKKIAAQRDKGNCLACHQIEQGEDAGNIGPSLHNIQAKFANKQSLKAIIWDATQFNKKTSMPPFGRNNILTPEEIDAVVNYIWSL